MTTDIQIDSNIPAPVRVGDVRGASAVLANKMQPGDSVLLSDMAEAERLINAMRHRKFKHSRRKVEGGHRVWRLS